ncbi:HMG box protein [Arthroderma uncinatum]|uniref:HMG box protein n=1 Tax=Arthroderma uncinatum TaxID=74035 RepID=UPI00144AAD0E|nr:HMG box protein [Arthroderma uncinatum]KAF3481493.1 HMG box protein [Arthroderma uncinatum]
MGFKLAQCGRVVCRRFNSRVLYVPGSGLRPDTTSIAAIANSYAAKASVLQLLSLSKSYATDAATPKTKSKAAPKKAAPKKADSKKADAKKPGPKKVALPPKRGRPGKTEKEKKAQAKEDLAALKSAVLTLPKLLPVTPFTVYATGKKGSIVGHRETFKELPGYEVEELREIAEKNSSTNQHNLKQWIESHSPLEIKNANGARRKLRRILSLSSRSRICSPIHDDRRVKRPRTAFMIYSLEKQRSGEYDHTGAIERIIEIAQTWKNEPASEKEKYKHLEVEDRTRYINEYRETYGEEPGMEASESEDF